MAVVRACRSPARSPAAPASWVVAWTKMMLTTAGELRRLPKGLVRPSGTVDRTRGRCPGIRICDTGRRRRRGLATGGDATPEHLALGGVERDQHHVVLVLAQAGLALGVEQADHPHRHALDRMLGADGVLPCAEQVADHRLPEQADAAPRRVRPPRSIARPSTTAPVAISAGSSASRLGCWCSSSGRRIRPGRPGGSR